MQLYEVWNKDGHYVKSFYDDYDDAKKEAYDLAEKIDGRVVVCWEKKEEY